MNPLTNWKVVLTHSCQLGESPVWDSQNQRIFWVDILQHEIHQFDTITANHTVLKINQEVGAIALRTSGHIVAALQHGFAFIVLESGSIELITPTEAEIKENRFNDGKCDPAGRFWAGTMAKSGKKEAGNVYTLETDLNVSVKITGVSVSNGMAWSPDHKTFYYIDTFTNSVVAYDYDMQSGCINNKRTVIQIPRENGQPDGMTIDTEGMLWIALWNGWKIGRWNPYTGKMIHSVSLPVAQVTSCSFGGKNLVDLYVTSARVGLTRKQLDKQPLAGCLFLIRNVGFEGIPENPFAG